VKGGVKREYDNGVEKMVEAAEFAPAFYFRILVRCEYETDA
jgi:hypothetical protein